MATVQRANVILQIADEPDLIQKYKDKGYNVIDNETGKVLERAMPNDVGTLQATILELQGQLRQKDDEIKSLRNKIKKLEKKLKGTESD